MQTRALIFMITTTVLLLLLDVYVFRGVKMHISQFSPGWKKFVSWMYWLPTLAFVLFLAYLFINGEAISATRSFRPFYFAFGFALTLLLPKLLYSFFLLTEDISQAIRYVIAKLSAPKTAVDQSHGITRLQFISQTGLVLSGLFMGSIVYGMVKGKYAFRFLSESITSLKFPQSAPPLKIIQISDTHLGSFAPEDPREMRYLIDEINARKPDLIFMTGDLVNNYASEAEPWIDFFASLQARLGKYSVLGNHDYSDYVPWPNEEDKAENLRQLERIHRDMGFRLLKNEHEEIPVGDAHISVIGIENWGEGGFAKYGDLEKALRDVNPDHFKILLSHDPSHWEAQVMGKKDIDLTLSGHTHGMQFGVEIGSLRFSPVQFRYKRWGGLYKEGINHLYVNRGFGFLGFPGRVGMPPEITEIVINPMA